MSVLLFDVDGTLTYPMKVIEADMIKILKDIKNKGYKLSVVGGSDYNKINTQLEGALELFDYICTENGLVTYHNNTIVSHSILEFMGEEKFQNLMNNILFNLSQINLPVKRDKFIEVRKACINVSPIGRSCSYEERIKFHDHDKINNIRSKLINALAPLLEMYGLTAVIGGMISIDIYPRGWDKTFCLNYFTDDEKIYFFGDKTDPGGNDYEIFHDSRVIGNKVIDPPDLIRQLSLLSECSVNYTVNNESYYNEKYHSGI